MERRWGNRVLLNERVRITRDGAVICFATLHEASISGGFVRTPNLMRNLTRIELELAPSGPHRDAQRCVEAFVVRQCPDGFGIEWCEFGPAIIADLLREPQLYTPRGEWAPVGHNEHARR